MMFKGEAGEIRRDHLLNVVECREHLERGLVSFVDIDGHVSWYSTEVVLRIRRRETFEVKRSAWPKLEGVAT